MDNGGGFLSSIVTQMGGGKNAVLSSDAPTIEEKHNNPLYVSSDRSAVYDDKRILPSKPEIWIDGTNVDGLLEYASGDKVEMKLMMKVVGYNYYENKDEEKKRGHNLKVVAVKLCK